MKCVKAYNLDRVDSVWVSGYKSDITLAIRSGNTTINVSLTLNQAQDLAKDAFNRVKSNKKNMLEELQENAEST